MSYSASTSPDVKPSRKHLEILIVESNPADARLFEIAFREAGLTSGLRFVEDGEDALRCVRREGEYAHTPLPDVIILDLSLPKVHGLTVLKEIKSTPSLTHIPIVVSSGSDDPADIRAVYALNGNCYIRKPNELSQFLRFIETCYDFWSSVVTLSPVPNLASEARLLAGSRASAV
jgi:CheY-like chemotaxis protein